MIEYVDGGNLRDWILDGKCLDYKTTLNLAIQFCHGMEHAHVKGMIHRDIKPANILMTKDGILKITDFGLVRTDEQKIGSGVHMGTPAYMSPEQWLDAHDVDERADIYSFGICLYEMFCGNRPEPREDTPSPDPAPMRHDKDFPPALAEVLKKCIQWNRDNRYDSLAPIRQDLTRIYVELFDEPSPYAELELVDVEADGLNNQGVSYMELEENEKAMECWEKALNINSMHLDSTFNQALILWREAKIADDEVLRRIENCGNNPSVDKEKLADLKASIHIERNAPDIAKDQFKIYPGKYREIISGKNIGQIKCVRTILIDCLISCAEITITPDGRNAILWANYKKSSLILDLQTGQCVSIMERHTGYIRAVTITPNSRYAVSGSEDKTLRLWELETGLCICTMEGHSDEVNAVTLTPDGRYAVSGSKDKNLRFWELKTGLCIRTMEGHSDEVNAVTLTPDGRYAVSGSKDKNLRLWDLKTGQCVSIMQGHIGSIKAITLTPGGKYAVSGSWDETLRLWDLKNGQCVSTMQGHTDSITAVTLTSDGKYAVSGSNDKTLRLWDFDTHGLCQSNLAISLPQVYDEKKTEVENYRKILHKAELLYKNGNYQQSFKNLCLAWETIDFAYEINSRRLYFKLMKRGRIESLLFSFQKHMMQGHTHQINALAITPDSLYTVSSGSLDRTLRMWDLKTGQCIRTMQGHTNIVSAVTITPDGQYAISGSWDKTLRIWNLETGQCTRTLEGHKHFVTAVTISLEGEYAISGSYDKTLCIWDLKTGHCVRTMKGHTDGIDAVNITRDGKYAISGSSDKTLRLWSLETGQCLHIMEGHTEMVGAIAITPDNRFAVSGSTDKTLRIWEIETGECVHTIQGHTHGITAVAITPDSQYVVSGSCDKTLRVWDLKSSQCVRSIKGHTDGIHAVTITPDSRYAVSGSSDQKLLLYEIIWSLEFPAPVDWDEEVRPYLKVFLERHKNNWSENDFQTLIEEIHTKRGFPHVGVEGIKRQLDKMVVQ